jgi:glycosyltransferase involved in cell wall biosynthesis
MSVSMKADSAAGSAPPDARMTGQPGCEPPAESQSPDQTRHAPPVPLRVLLVNLARGFGGAEVRVLAMARALRASVTAVAVAVLRDSPLHQRLAAEGLPTVALDHGRGDPRLLFALRKVIRDGRYTVVDAHNVQSIFWSHLAAALAGAPGRVATIHSDVRKEYGWLKGRLYGLVLWLDRFLARETVIVNPMLSGVYAGGWPARHLSSIANAIPVAETPPAAPDMAARQKWQCATDEFVVVVPARLNPVKGHRYLLQALTLLVDLPNIVVLIAGDGPLRADLEAMAMSSGLAAKVRFLGFVDATESLLLAADCVCLPSLTEAMPFVILEAAAAARPMLASRVGGIPSLVEHRQTGYLVPPADPDALAGGLRWLAGHPEEARRMGRAANDRVRSEFRIETMLGQTLDVYCRAVG